MPAAPISVVVLVALFVTLIPTTIGALLSAIGIAGMDRLVRFNVLAMSGRAVEAAGDVDTLLLDKTGTITLGNRQATEFKPVRGVDEQELADAAQLASLADETPEGRSIVVLAKEKYGIRGRDLAELRATLHPVHRADPHERRRGRRRPGSARARSTRSSNYLNDARRRRYAPGGAVRALQPARQRRGGARDPRRSPTRSPSPAARRWRWPRTAGCSASSTSRTSSRAASASASPSCAAWASAPS